MTNNILDAHIPAGDIEKKWSKYRSTVPLINPANKRNLEIIVIGSGLAGASAAASLAELGYKVKVFAFRIQHEGHIVLLHKEGSMRQRTIRMMATQFIAYFMIQLKAVITVRAKPTYIALPK